MMRRATLALLLATSLTACPSLDDLLARPDADGGPLEAGRDATDATDADTRDANADATPGLVAGWDFDEDGGRTARDLSGHGHDMTLALGSALGPSGVRGGALVLTGTGFASAASLYDGAFPRTGTLAFFCRYPNDDGGLTSIVDGHEASRSHVFVRRTTNNGGGIQVALQFADAGADASYAFERSFAGITGQWIHVALAWSEGDAVASLYVDGALRFTDAYKGPFAPVDQRWNIGNGFVGEVDELRLFDRVLSAAEISALAKTND